ncbi:MAG: TOBE domain-containing protein [Cyanobacteriota bacterium]
MNKIEGIISKIESSGNISLIHIDVEKDTFYSIIINIEEYIQIGKKITLLFKETELIVAKNISQEISISNKFMVNVEKIEKDNIISKLYLEYKKQILVSLLITKDLEKLDLKEGESIIAFLKASEIILMEQD